MWLTLIEPRGSEQSGNAERIDKCVRCQSSWQLYGKLMCLRWAGVTRCGGVVDLRPRMKTKGYL